MAVMQQENQCSQIPNSKSLQQLIQSYIELESSRALNSVMGFGFHGAMVLLYGSSVVCAVLFFVGLVIFDPLFFIGLIVESAESAHIVHQLIMLKSDIPPWSLDVITRTLALPFLILAIIFVVGGSFLGYLHKTFQVLAQQRKLLFQILTEVEDSGASITAEMPVVPNQSNKRNQEHFIYRVLFLVAAFPFVGWFFSIMGSFIFLKHNLIRPKRKNVIVFSIISGIFWLIILAASSG